MKSLAAIAILCGLIFNAANAQSELTPEELAKKHEFIDTAIWKKGQYLSDNQVRICTSKTDGKCSVVTMPDAVGKVSQIVYGEVAGNPNAWLAFTEQKISLCAARKHVVCTPVSGTNGKGVRISYDHDSEYPTVIYRTKSENSKDVAKVDVAFRQLIAAALIRLESNEALSKTDKCANENCEITTQAEDPVDGGIVYITAAFPDISVIDGATQFIPVNFLDGSTEGGNSELPSGVAPSDIMNARNPAGMAKCTKDAMSTYLLLYTGCFSRYRTPTMIKMCADDSMAIYRDILRNECYPKYY
jgi:hypothetical protein